MLFLTNKLDYIILYYIILDYITQINNEIIKEFLRLGSFIAAARYYNTASATTPS